MGGKCSWAKVNRNTIRNKRQNKMGGFCSYYDDMYHSCDWAQGDAKVCKGNPHMCRKVTLRRYARLKERQKIDGSLPLWLKHYIELRDAREKVNNNEN